MLQIWTNALLRSYTTAMPLLSVLTCLVDSNVNVEKAIRIHGRTINTVQEGTASNVLRSTVTIGESANIKTAKKSVCKYL